MLAVGDPAASEKTDRPAFVRNELRAVTASFPGSKEISGDEIRKQDLISNMTEFNIIHFASQCRYDSSNFLDIGLLQTSADKHPDSLGIREIFGLKLISCRLTVFSALDHFPEKRDDGSEITVLNYAFHYAGAPRILTTLWKTDDLATAVLMKRFYRYLHFGDPPGLALQKSQRIVRDRIHSQPAYWAAFTLYGESEGTLNDAK